MYWAPIFGCVPSLSETTVMTRSLRICVLVLAVLLDAPLGLISETLKFVSVNLQTDRFWVLSVLSSSVMLSQWITSITFTPHPPKSSSLPSLPPILDPRSCAWYPAWAGDWGPPELGSTDSDPRAAQFLQASGTGKNGSRSTELTSLAPTCQSLGSPHGYPPGQGSGPSKPYVLVLGPDS